MYPPPPPYSAPLKAHRPRARYFQGGGLEIYKADNRVKSSHTVLWLYAPQITLPEIYTRRLHDLISQEPTEVLVLLVEGQRSTRSNTNIVRLPQIGSKWRKKTKSKSTKSYIKMFSCPRYITLGCLCQPPPCQWHNQNTTRPKLHGCLPDLHLSKYL